MLVVLLALYLADLAMNRGNVPRGTTVGGVAIGGMAPEEAERSLEQELGGVAAKPVTVHAAAKEATVVPEQAGLGIDWPATVAAAGVQSANSVTRLTGLFRTHEVDAVTVVDDAALNPQLDRLVKELHVEPVDGAINVEAGQGKVTDPKLGQDVPRPMLRDELTTSWLNPQGVTVQPEEVQPAVNNSVIQAAMSGTVATSTSIGTT